MRRLSRRRSGGPEGTEPPTAAAQGTDGAPNQTPAEAEGHTSLLADPAAPTRVLRPGDPQTVQGGEDAHSGDREPGPAPGAAYAPVQPGSATPDPGAPHGAGRPGATTGEPAPGTPYAGPQPAYVPFSTGQAVPGAPYSVQGPADPEQGPVADLPPGLDPDELAAAPPSSARRGRLRKRVAFLRAARELLLRDLGGFIYELHRTAGDVEHDAHRRLRAAKLDRLTTIDAELHVLEQRLDDVRRNVVVREPGVGGECPECGELFGSDAHYCSHCGLPLTESARRALARAASAAPEPVVAAPEPVAPTPVDQQTREMPPAAQGTEFEWPQRTPATSGEAATGDQGEPAAGDAPRGDAETGGAADAPREDAAAGGAADAAREDAAAGGAADAPREDATAGGAADAPRGDATPGGADDATGGDAAGSRRDATSGGAGDPAHGDAAADEAGDSPRADADDDAPGTAPAPEPGGEGTAGDVPASGGEAPRAAEERPNGRASGSTGYFSRAERGE